MAKSSSTGRSRKCCWHLCCGTGGFIIAFAAAFTATIILTKAYKGVPVPRACKEAQSSCLIVRTKSGLVQGTLSGFKSSGIIHTTVAFYGIPFANPPVGKLRFARPTCASPWNGVFNATYKRPPCVQENLRYPKNIVVDASNTTEDCLHVNVWVPGSCVGEERSRRLAIVFFLYGGAFTGGGNSYDIYDGRFIAALGDVLVVVPNYRLSTFGFLNSGTGDVPGNMALHDQLLALRWLHENAEQFGGDRESILVVGHSAGAMTAALFMASPLVARHGSFQRAYLMSGAMRTPMPINKGKRAKASFAQIAASVGCRAEQVASQVQCLRCLNASEIRNGSRSSAASMVPSVEGPMFPGGFTALEKRFLPYRWRDTMMSTAHQEGMAIVQLFIPGVIEKREPITPERLQQAFPSMFGTNSLTVINFLIGTLSTSYNLNDPENKGWIEVFGDLLFRCPILAAARDLAGMGANVYLHVFIPKPSFTPFAGDSATHGEDVVMLFGYPFQYPNVATDEERATSRRMITTLANFAKNGSAPALVDGSPWPLFSNASGYSLVEHTHAGYKIMKPGRSCKTADSLLKLLEQMTDSSRARAWSGRSLNDAAQESLTLQPPHRSLEAHPNGIAEYGLTG